MLDFIERMEREGRVEVRMERHDARALLVQCACADPDAYYNPGCHLVVSGTLVLQGADGKWLISADNGDYYYVDLLLQGGTVVHASTPDLQTLPEPCERVKLERLDGKAARQVANKLVAQYAHNFDKTRPGGLFCRFSACASCSKLATDRCYGILHNTLPSDDGYYLHGVHALPIMQLMRVNSLHCTCPRR